MSKNTVQENINRAIQIHVENAVKGLQFNKTELVEIADITNRDKGEYVVFNGSIKYYAYSENTKYALRDKVYVNIPNNDYSQQKIIVGKYKVGGDKISYISHWDNFTPMTENINTDKSIYKISNTKKGPIKILNISPKNPDDLSKYNGYEYMGVKAYFNARFPGANSGNYGIEIALTYNDPQVPGRQAKEKTNYYILDTNSMIGNIYNFPSFYNQEAVFKIPKDIKITRIIVNFFCDESLLEYGTISMRNLNLRFGNEKTTEMDSLELYCEQGAEYNSSLGDKNDENKKILKIKWCHYDKDEEQLKEINKEITSLNSGEAVNLYYNIKWYRKIIKKVDGSDTNDNNNDNFEKDWEDITSNSNFFASSSTSNPPRDLDLFSRKIYPTVLQKEDSFKVIIEYGPKDGNNINTKSYFYKKLESKVYTFKNTAEIPDYTSFDFANTKIIATDDYEGNYHIYDGKNGKILKRTDASKKRELELEMISSYTNESYLNGSETVYWIIPKVNTMINFEPYVSNLQTTLKSGNKFRKLNKFIKDISHYYVIGQTNRKDGEKYKYSINYQIKEYYTKQAVKNTIYCFVYKNNQMAQTNLTLTFGQHGTAGTDYTLTLGLGNLYDKDWNIKGGADTALTFGSSNYREIVFALYDENNKEITLTDNQKNAIINRWITGHKDGYLYGADRAKKYLDFLTQQSNNKYSRIAVRVPSKDSNGISNWTRDHIGGIIFKISFSANYVFTQYLPLHVKYSSGYDLEGSDSIIYSDSGTNPVYYKDRFDLIGRDPKNALTIEISSTSKNEELKKYLPTFNDKFKLCPSPLYVDIGEGISVILKEAGVAKYIFSLLIMQNAYGVPTINKWDGSLTIDNENNQILSAMVGAGIKNSDNTFTGVLMGEIGTDNSNKLYGLYGYDKGIQSYGFKINGTAFIGKSGTGRILFDGNKGIIESAAYATSGKGSYINLANGSIVLDSTRKKQDSDEWENDGNAKITLRTRSDNMPNPYYFRIEANYNNNLKTLMNVGKDNYYLQTANYENNKAGTKLDLQNGSLVSYGALTLKGADNSTLDFTGKIKNFTGDAVTGSGDFNGYIRFGIPSSGMYFKMGYKPPGLSEKNLIRFDGNYAFLKSANYAGSTDNDESKTEIYSNEGTFIDLQKGLIRSKNFVIAPNGNAFFKGKITANSGSIGGWEITSGGIRSIKKDDQGKETGAIRLYNSGSIAGKGTDGSWSIKEDGSATFSKVTITGGTLSLNGIKYDSKSLKNNGSWSSVKDWDNNTLGRYIDQRIADFDDVNIWGKLTAHQEVFLRNDSANMPSWFSANANSLKIDSNGVLTIRSTAGRNKNRFLTLNVGKIYFDYISHNEQPGDQFYTEWMDSICAYVGVGSNFDNYKIYTLKDLLNWYMRHYTWGNGDYPGIIPDMKIKGVVVPWEDEYAAWIASGQTMGSMIGENLCPSGYKYYSGNPYKVWGNCTSGAWMMVYHTYGIQLPGNLGNGGQWVDSLVAMGWTKYDRPVPGSIVSVKGTYYGHVAFVVSVNENGTYNAFEGNYNPPKNAVIGGHAQLVTGKDPTHWSSTLPITVGFVVPPGYENYINNSGGSSGGGGNTTPN